MLASNTTRVITLSIIQIQAERYMLSITQIRDVQARYNSDSRRYTLGVTQIRDGKAESTLRTVIEYLL